MSLRSLRRQQTQVHRELPGLQPLPIYPVAASPLEVDGMHDCAHPNINDAECVHIARADDRLDAQRNGTRACRPGGRALGSDRPLQPSDVPRRAVLRSSRQSHLESRAPATRNPARLSMLEGPSGPARARQRAATSLLSTATMPCQVCCGDGASHSSCFSCLSSCQRVCALNTWSMVHPAQSAISIGAFFYGMVHFGLSRLGENRGAWTRPIWAVCKTTIQRDWPVGNRVHSH